MSRRSKLPLNHTFCVAYTVGIVMCVCCPLALQLNLDKIIIPRSYVSSETIQSIGYTFTGLTLTCIITVTLRWKKIRSNFSKLTEGQQGKVLLREIVLYSTIFVLSSFFGTTYYLLGGTPVKSFARNFITLTPIMFFVFIPRLSTWQKASKDNR